VQSLTQPAACLAATLPQAAQAAKAAHKSKVCR